MKTSQKGFISPLLLALIALLLFGGGVYVYMQKNQTTQPVTATSTSQTSNPQTADWKTYSSAEYGFEAKYPNTWEVQDYKKGQGFSSPDTVGFVPQNLSDFPQCAQDAQNLRENYKSQNPFPGYEQYSDTSAKTDCGIHFRVELNTAHDSLTDFLNRNFSTDQSLKVAIGELQVIADGSVQKVVSPRYFFSFDSGFVGGVKAIVLGGPQYIISTRDFVIFIYGSRIVDDKSYDSILTTVVQNIKVVI